MIPLDWEMYKCNCCGETFRSPDIYHTKEDGEDHFDLYCPFCGCDNIEGDWWEDDEEDQEQND